MDEFIVALLANPSVEAAAAAVGIGRVTAWRWLKDPDVIARCREARRDALRHTTARLQEAARASVECLDKVQHEGESESARVSAARTLLELSLKAADTEDIHSRLDLLEQAVKSQKKGNDDDEEKHAAAGATRGFRSRR